MLFGHVAIAWAIGCIALVTHSVFVEARPKNSHILKFFDEPKCGYASCPKTKLHMLNVHLVPHTHDDVGWLKTVDQYYYGSQTLIQKAGVQYILDSVVQELLKDPSKRFIYVESAFFFKWWHEQTPALQQQVKTLVDEGRLEFIGGAWSMNDEATTHYQSVIDQFTWGLRRLNDTFGECGRPRIGWQIDPFGHSREMASMFAQMGYDGLFFGRLDYQDKDERLMTQKAEMIWRASANQGESSHLFTGALYNQYQPPPGFCFDILCADEPIIDGKHSPDNNVKRRVDKFFDFINKQKRYYRTNNIIVTMGGDFTYQDANVYYKNLDKLMRYAVLSDRLGGKKLMNILMERGRCLIIRKTLIDKVDEFFAFVKNMSLSYRTQNVLITMGEDFHYQNANSWYKNLDKLIKYANERQANGSTINLLYSTPSCYLKSLHDAGITWPTKDDDFFPYASDPHAYWTGYFTSRPTLKRYERVGNHFLQVCKQLTSLAPRESPEFLPHLSFMRETMGIMQHHDAVTGTEKQKVAFDYAKRLEVGLRACSTNTRAVLNRLTSGEGPLPVGPPPLHAQFLAKNYAFEFKTCPLLNISNCDVSEEKDQFVLTLYNPLAHSTFEYVRVPVTDVHYLVMDYRDVIVETQFVPIPEGVQKLSFRDSDAKYELVFLATELPPLGYKSYYFTKSKGHRLKPVPEPTNLSSLTSIGNEYIRLTFDTNGFLSSVMADGMTRILNQEFLYYEGAVGNNREFRNRSSGAYIFRPVTDNVHSITMAPKIKVYRGDMVEEVHQVFNEWISQVVRVYRQQRYAEFEWLVGPIPVDDNRGKEIISRFNSDIQSEGIFYTDSNGREMIKRLRDHRDTWRVKLLERTAGNYYPITTKIALEDENARMAILTDRAQGGTSLGDGSLELMLHRRLLHDDAFGVDETLNETAYGQGLVARGTHYLVVGSSQLDQSPTTQSVERFTQLQTLLPTWKFFSDGTAYAYEEWRDSFTNIFSGISLSLPQNINLMSFEPWHEHEILIRFEHILEKDEDPKYSKIIKFNLKDVLRGFKLADIRATTLDGNEWLGDRRRMEFVPDPEDEAYDYDRYSVFAKSSDYAQLLRADKPLLDTKYAEQMLPNSGLGAESNRLKRRATPRPQHKQLNRLRSELLKKMKVHVSDLPLMDDDDTKYVIELGPMEIRTYILFLEH